MEEEFSRYCNAYQEMNQRFIDRINECCSPDYKKGALYKREFFKNNSTLSEVEWYVWKHHYFTKDWEVQIWTMSDDEFKYSWPYHAGFIEEFILHNSLQDISLLSED